MLEKTSQPNSFNVRQLFNNSKGSSAISLVTAFMLSLVGSVCFTYCVFCDAPYHAESVMISGLGTTLFTARAIVKKD